MLDAEGRVCQLEDTDRKLMEAIRDAILIDTMFGSRGIAHADELRFRFK